MLFLRFLPAGRVTCTNSGISGAHLFLDNFVQRDKCPPTLDFRFLPPGTVPSTAVIELGGCGVN